MADVAWIYSSLIFPENAEIILLLIKITTNIQQVWKNEMLMNLNIKDAITPCHVPKTDRMAVSYQI